MVLGMGAFAIENVRTSFEHSAAHVAILCRRRGTVCPQICDWVNFIRPFNADGKHEPAGDAVSLGYWQRAYDISGAKRPECWKDGILKPDGHTVSTSDLYFLAHYLGVAAVHLGAVFCLNERSVTTQDAETYQTDIVIKAVGFELNEGNERLLGRVRMRCNSHLEGSLWLQLEPHLDARFFNSPFGSSYLNEVRFNASVMMRLLQAPLQRGRVAQLPMPHMRINSFTASESHEGQDLLQAADPAWPELLQTHLQGIASDFNASMSPEEYVAQNQQLWKENHTLLAKLAGEDSARPHLDYPFAQLIFELPDLAYALTTEAPAAAAASSSQAARPALSEITVDEVMTVVHEIVGDAGPSDGSGVSQDTALIDTSLLDSLAVAELRSWLSARAGITVSAQAVFDYPTMRQLTAHVIELGQKHAPLPAPVVADPSSYAPAAAQSMAARMAESIRVARCSRELSERASAPPSSNWAPMALATSMMAKFAGAPDVLRDLARSALEDEARVGSLLSYMHMHLFVESPPTISSDQRAQMAEIFFALCLSPSGILPKTLGPPPNAAAGTVLIMGYAGSGGQLRAVRELYARARPQWRVVSVTAVKDPVARATQMSKTIGELAASGPLVVHCMSNHGHKGYLSLLELHLPAVVARLRALVFDCGPAIDLKADDEARAVAHTAFSALLAHDIPVARAQQDQIRVAARNGWSTDGWSWQTPADIQAQASREPCVPTLCICGQEDDLCPPAAMQEYAGLLGAGDNGKRAEKIRVASLRGGHCSVLSHDAGAYEGAIVQLLDAIHPA